jgi:hypothetical protein
VFAPATCYLTPAEQEKDDKNLLSTTVIPAPLGAGITTELKNKGILRLDNSVFKVYLIEASKLGISAVYPCFSSNVLLYVDYL